MHTRGDLQQLRNEKEQLTEEKNQLVAEKNQLVAEKNQHRDERDAAVTRATAAEQKLEKIQKDKQAGLGK